MRKCFSLCTTQWTINFLHNVHYLRLQNYLELLVIKLNVYQLAYLQSWWRQKIQVFHFQHGAHKYLYFILVNKTEMLTMYLEIIL